MTTFQPNNYIVAMSCAHRVMSDIIDMRQRKSPMFMVLSDMYFS